MLGPPSIFRLSDSSGILRFRNTGNARFPRAHCFNGIIWFNTFWLGECAMEELRGGRFNCESQKRGSTLPVDILCSVNWLISFGALQLKCRHSSR